MSLTNGSLLRRASPLAEAAEQVRILESTPGIPGFAEMLARHELPPPAAAGIDVIQINVGRKCNQACAHCHVDAGPDRTEMMSRRTAEECIAALARSDIPRVDLTGGAPELNPNFRRLVREARRLGRHVMDRCNLTVLHLPEQADLAPFLAEHQVEVICSLPCYTGSTTDAQRGNGVHRRSIEALRLLNGLGYGRSGTGLMLNLVHNPVGAFLPGPQRSLEADYHRNLEEQFGVTFNHLYAITNMPISRFLEFLMQSGRYESYMERLVAAFNPAAVDGVMCRTTLSVGWDGRLYDCDFNQMLGIAPAAGVPAHIRDFDPARLAGRRIVTGRHCYGCTAGAGSGCTGITTGEEVRVA